MKRWIALVLAAAMMAALFCMPAMAETDPAKLIKILMSTDEVTLYKPDVGTDITPEQMQAAIDAALEAEEEIIPEDWNITADRMTLFQRSGISCKLPVYDVTFKFWSSTNNAVCIFFLGEDSDTWELLSCEMGDVAEARFNGNGVYAITMCW